MMMKHTGMIVVAALVVVVLLLGTVAFTVPSTEKVLVKTFGKTTRVLYGDRDADAGLHLKWPYPIQTVIRYDARTFAFEDPHMQFETSDKQQMFSAMYCAWRVDDPDKFHRSVETVETAEQRLRSLLNNKKRDVLTKYDMSRYVNTDETSMKLDEMARKIHALMKDQARKDYGVEIAQVGFKSLSLPEKVTADVIEAMKKERQKEVQRYRASGEAMAKAIRKWAERARDQVLAFARNKADRIRAEGEAAATEYYAIFQENETLAVFIRELMSLRKILADKVLLVLDPESLRPLRYFSAPPTAAEAGPPARESTEGQAAEPGTPGR